jgi:hypothetical protein
MLSNLPPDKGRRRISRGFAVALIATSLITAASLAYLSRSSSISLDKVLREPLPAPSPEMIATAKVRADLRRTAEQKREHEFGLVIANGRIQRFQGASSNVPTTLDRVVEAIRGLVSPAPNIIMHRGIDSLPLDNINLRWPSPSQEQLEAVLKALASSTGGRFTVIVERNENVGRGFTVNNHGAAGVLSSQSGSGPTYVLARSEARAPSPVIRVAAFNIAALLPANLEASLADARARHSDLSTVYGPMWPPLLPLTDEINRLERAGQDRVEGIEKVLRDTLSSVTPRALSPTDFPVLRYHQGAGLLVATGTDAALEVLGKIVTAMGGTAGAAPAVTDTPPPAVAPANRQARAATQTVPVARRATITVAADHSLRWNGQPFTVVELPEKLRAFTLGAAPESRGVDFEIEGALTVDTTIFIRSLAEELKKAGVATLLISRKDLSGSPPSAAPPKP